MTITYAQAISVHEQADLLVSGETIAKSIETMAADITATLSKEMPLVLCVLNGKKTVGTNLSWLARPSIDINNRTVLVVDDIYDEGHTLAAICEYLKEAGAKKVYAAALLNKVHDRKVDYVPDFIGLDVEDRFVYGFGMDYQGYFRNVDGIYAVKDM